MKEIISTLYTNRVATWLRADKVRAVYVNAEGTTDYEVCKTVDDFKEFYRNGRYWEDNRHINFKPIFVGIKYFINPIRGEGIDYGDRVEFMKEHEIDWI